MNQGSTFTFGERVVGKDAFKVQQHVRQFSYFGPRVRDSAEIATTEPEPTRPVATEVPEGFYRIEDIAKALQENPSLYDKLYEAELKRPDGPRRSAMRMFLQAEMTRPGGIRPERQAEIESYLVLKR